MRCVSLQPVIEIFKVLANNESNLGIKVIDLYFEFNLIYG